ncbi:hypothetical protein J7J18_04030 [bacterium]|nr:hypothetical protein [bacterium]
MQRKRLVLIDANSLIHRTYHALPSLTTKKAEPVNAVYGFLLVFLKAIREFQPDFIAACFDSPGPTFRHKKFKEYKAKRPPIPKDLVSQIPKVKEVLSAFGVPIFEKKGFEADDLIGAISKITPPDTEVIILSGDMDILQLINSRTRVFLLKTGIKNTHLYDQNMVKEEYGIFPSQIVDFKALRGDPSDNIPGVAGIGEKTAIDLLKRFGNLENLYKELEENSEKAKEIRQKTRGLLLRHKKDAFLSKDLAKIKKDIPLRIALEECSFEKYNREKAIEGLKKFEFYSLTERLPEPTLSLHF